MAKEKHVPANQNNTKQGIGFKVLEDKEHDVAWAYAVLSGGTVPPAIRGEDLEDS